MTAALHIRDLAKSYQRVVAVERFEADVARGEFIVLLGPSGCGKTTTLRMIAGFVQPSRGTILLDGRDITRMPPYRRNTAMVFQSYALFPNMTVHHNVAFGLRMRSVSAAETDRRVHEALGMVRMADYASRYPRELSGGQQQRVALARAVVTEPALLLLDEPLSNLDAKLRAEVRGEIRSLQRRLGLTALMVTHDQEEALSMADRIIVMKDGNICQVGTPTEIYEHPRNSYIASFIGNYNLIPGRLTGLDAFASDEGDTFACMSGPRKPGARALMAVRPDLVRIGTPPADSNRLNGAIVEISYLGAQREIVIAVGTRLIRSFRPAQEDPGTPWSSGQPVHVWWPKTDALIVDPE